MTDTAVREKPILFSGPMVRAILSGTKTQTRRVIKCACNCDHLGRRLGEWGLSIPPHRWNGDEGFLWHLNGKHPQPGDWIEQYQTDVDDHACSVVACPYGDAGDRLWVREAFYDRGDYATIGKVRTDRIMYVEDGVKSGWKSHPSIHMPRWASRITLEIAEVRVERLQEITEEDAIAEGVDADVHAAGGLVNNGYYRSRFFLLWDKLNSKRGFGSKVDPWVFVIAFRRVE